MSDKNSVRDDIDRAIETAKEIAALTGGAALTIYAGRKIAKAMRKRRLPKDALEAVKGHDRLLPATNFDRFKSATKRK